MTQLAEVHSEETEKNFEEVFLDDVKRENRYHQSFVEAFWEKFETLGLTSQHDDIYESEFVSGNQVNQYNERYMTEQYTRDYKPFTEDAAVFPEDWKIYGEDMDRYERAKRMFDSPSPIREDPNRPMIPRDQSPWTKRY